MAAYAKTQGEEILVVKDGDELRRLAEDLMHREPSGPGLLPGSASLAERSSPMRADPLAHVHQLKTHARPAVLRSAASALRWSGRSMRVENLSDPS